MLGLWNNRDYNKRIESTKKETEEVERIKWNSQFQVHATKRNTGALTCANDAFSSLLPCDIRIVTIKM